MRKNKLSSALSGALVATMLLSASHVAAAPGVTINGEACGIYQDLTLNKLGHLTLTGDFSCLSASVPPVTDQPPVDTEPPVDSGAPAECGTAPKGLVTNYKNPLLQSMTGSATRTIGLKPSEIYSFKLNNSDNMLAYGSFSTISVLKASGTRTIAISECPGEMEPLSSANPKYNACEFVGGEGRVNWSFSNRIPGGLANCRLEPGKQYYINIKHQGPNGEESCKGSECHFSYDYNARKI